MELVKEGMSKPEAVELEYADIRNTQDKVLVFIVITICTKKNSLLEQGGCF
jgi:hypothetical protein